MSCKKIKTLNTEPSDYRQDKRLVKFSKPLLYRYLIRQRSGVGEAENRFIDKIIREFDLK